MANSHSYAKKWKYLSFALMGILATGFLFPQAFAAPVDSILIIVQDIQAKVTSIKTTVDANLDSKVSSRATPMKVEVASVRSDLDVLDELQCTSSSDYIAHVSLISRENGGGLSVESNYGFYDVKETGYLEFGQTANRTITFKAIATLPDFVGALITIETAQGATVTCVSS